VIGHLKADHRLGRCHLRGEIGDMIHAVLCAAGYNIRWLLRMIRAKGLRAFLRLLRAMAAIAVCGEQRLSVGPKLARMRLSHRHVPTPYTLAVG
jgi:IS5 family transposase